MEAADDLANPEREAQLIAANMALLRVQAAARGPRSAEDDDVARGTHAAAGMLQVVAAPAGPGDLRETDLVTVLRQGFQAAAGVIVTVRSRPTLSGHGGRGPTPSTPRSGDNATDQSWPRSRRSGSTRAS